GRSGDRELPRTPFLRRHGVNRSRVQVPLHGAAVMLYGVLENLMSGPDARRQRLVATGRVPVSVWVAALSCLAMIVGGLSEWATAWGFVSLSASRFHGANEVGAGIV